MNRAQRRTMQRKIPIHFRGNAPAIRLALLKLMTTSDIEEKAVILTHGYAFMLNHHFDLEITSREVLAIIRPILFRWNEMASEGKGMVEIAETLQEEIITRGNLFGAPGQDEMVAITPEMVQQITGRTITKEELDNLGKGCPDTCYTSGKPPHVRHYHGPDCPLNDWSQLDLEHATASLPGLVKIIWNANEKQHIAVHILKDQSEAVMWLNTGIHEYHLPMEARLAFHRDVPCCLVRVDLEQPIYEVREK